MTAMTDGQYTRLPHSGGPGADYEYGMTLSMLADGVLKAEPLITDRIVL